MPFQMFKVVSNKIVKKKSCYKTKILVQLKPKNYFHHHKPKYIYIYIYICVCICVEAKEEMMTIAYMRNYVE